MKKLIIFDLDGVVADSYDYCLKVNQKMYDDLTEEQYLARLHGNICETSKGSQTEAEQHQTRDRYWKIFGEGIDSIKLFPEMPDILTILSKDYELAIVSSCKDNFIGYVLEKENANHFFKKHYGSFYHESKEEKIKHALRDFEVKKDDCIFITDTLGDLVEAHKAGINSIAVTWGFHDRQTLEHGKHLEILDSQNELTKTIDKYLKN